MLCFSTNGVPYFSAVYKQLDKLVSKPRVKMRWFPTNMKDERETYIYIYISIYTYIYEIFSLDRSRRCRIKAHNHYDTRLYFISLFREAGCAMFGFMLYSRRRSCFSFFLSQIFDRYRKQEELPIRLKIKQSNLEDVRKREGTRLVIGADKS